MKVKISKNAFLFCRIGVTVLAWLAFLWRSKLLLSLIFLILLFSAILKIRKAPMIVLYNSLFGKIDKQKTVELDEDGMRFAHKLGSVFSGICVLLVYFNISYAWAIVLIFAVMKTISAFGFCPGEKLHACMKNGCCSLTKK